MKSISKLKMVKTLEKGIWILINIRKKKLTTNYIEGVKSKVNNNKEEENVKIERRLR